MKDVEEWSWGILCSVKSIGFGLMGLKALPFRASGFKGFRVRASYWDLGLGVFKPSWVKS